MVDPGSRAPDVFYGLSPRLSVLLGILFMHGGEEDLYLLDLLPDDDAYVLKERAQLLTQLEGKRRAAVVAQEMRRQFQFRGLMGLDQVDASWLLAALRGENPSTIGIILAQISTGSRSRILSSLPEPIREKVPTKEELKGVRLEVMRIVRQIFESRFVAMPMPPSKPTHFYFRDIGLLEGREIVQLVRALGLEELGAVFLTVGRRKLAELCQKLGREAAEELVAAVKQTEQKDALSLDDANTFLQRMLVGIRLDEIKAAGGDVKEKFQTELFFKAGLFRLAKSLSKERPSFVQQIAQRLPRSHGRLLRTYVERMDQMIELDDARIRRLQDMVLQRVEKLAARGKVNPQYLQFTFCYWGEGEAPAEGAEAPVEEEAYE